MINPFSARGLGVPGGASGEETLLTTWLVADGYKMDIDVQTIDFSGYCARYVDNTRLYLIDERWGTEQTRDFSTTLVRTSFRFRPLSFTATLSTLNPFVNWKSA